MQKHKGIPAKFFFTIRRALIKQAHSGLFKIYIRRKDKAVHSKDFQFSSETTQIPISEVLEFPTTMQQDGDSYRSKTVTIQGIFAFSNGSAYQASADVQLTEFLGSEALFRTIKLEAQGHSAQVDFECKSTLTLPGETRFKSAANIMSGNSESISKQDLNETSKSHKQLGLQVRRKQKTLLVIQESTADENDLIQPKKGFATCETPLPNRLGLKRSNTNFQFGAARAREFTFGETTVGESPAERAHTPEMVGCAPIQEEEIKEEIQTPKGSTSLGKFHSTTSIEESTKKLKTEDPNLLAIRQLKDKVKDLEKANKVLSEENRKLTSLNRQMQEKISLQEGMEQNSQDSKTKLMERLKQDIEAKNRQIKEISEELERQKKYLKQQEDLTMAARKQMDKLILKGSKVSPAKQNGSGKQMQKEMEKLRKDYEERIQDLKEQISRLSALSDPKAKVDICLSKTCDQQKKQLKAKAKQIQKALDEKDVQLETKERLIKNYESVKKDRETQNASIDLSKQMEKWRSQRLILQQQIDDLKHSKKQGSKAQDKQDILTLKIQKQTMSREMDRLKRSLGQLTKDKQAYETTSQKLQEQLISTKQKVVDLLNGIQEYGGMKLYDTICNIIE